MKGRIMDASANPINAAEPDEEAPQRLSLDDNQTWLSIGKALNILDKFSVKRMRATCGETIPSCLICGCVCVRSCARREPNSTGFGTTVKSYC